MSGSENSTVEKAFDNYLRAEYEEQQYSRWAPSGLPKATEKRVAAARALDKMGVDISVMRRQRIEAAIGEMVERLALEGVRATVRRKGVRMVLESPDKVDLYDKSLNGFLQWAKARGISYCSCSWPGRAGQPASIAEFKLTAPNQDTWVTKPEKVIGSEELAATETETAFLSRAEVARRGVIDWWSVEGVPVFVSVGDNSEPDGSKACLVLESGVNIDTLRGKYARFEVWISANGMKRTQWGSGTRQGIICRMVFSPGPTKREWVNSSHLDDKAEAAEIDVGRIAIEHVTREPKYQPTRSEDWGDLANRLAFECGVGGGPSRCDWREWTG